MPTNETDATSAPSTYERLQEHAGTAAVLAGAGVVAFAAMRVAPRQALTRANFAVRYGVGRFGIVNQGRPDVLHWITPRHLDLGPYRELPRRLPGFTQSVTRALRVQGLSSQQVDLQFFESRCLGRADQTATPHGVNLFGRVFASIDVASMLPADASYDDITGYQLRRAAVSLRYNLPALNTLMNASLVAGSVFGTLALGPASISLGLVTFTGFATASRVFRAAVLRSEHRLVTQRVLPELTDAELEEAARVECFEGVREESWKQVEVPKMSPGSLILYRFFRSLDRRPPAMETTQRMAEEHARRQAERRGSVAEQQVEATTETSPSVRH